MDIVFWIIILILPWPFFMLAQKEVKPGRENYNILYYAITTALFLMGAVITIAQEDITYQISETWTMGENVTKVETTHQIISTDKDLAFFEMSTISLIYMMFGALSAIFTISEGFLVMIRRGDPALR